MAAPINPIRLPRGNRQPLRVRGADANSLLLALLAALAGCRANYYRAAQLPQQLQVPPAAASTELKLEQLSAAGTGTSQIGPGDLVEITIVSGNGEERSTPTPARIAEDGSVLVPLIGPVQVGGLEPLAAEQRIAASAIERDVYRQPYVTLTIKERAVNRVTVLGAVAKPGVVELPRGSCDLASALAAAGGLTKDAGMQVDVLHRGGNSFLAGSAQHGGPGPRLAANIDPAHPLGIPFAPPELEAPAQAMTRIDLAQAEGVAADRRLEDRDMVMVLPEEKRVIHVTGLVARPNQFDISRSQDVRVLDAIAMAGGVSSPVADKVFVIRQIPDSPEPAVIKVSIAAAKQNGNENLRLTAGDLVSVESTVSTMTLDTVTKFFRVGLGLSGNLAAF